MALLLEVSKLNVHEDKDTGFLSNFNAKPDSCQLGSLQTKESKLMGLASTAETVKPYPYAGAFLHAQHLRGLFLRGLSVLGLGCVYLCHRGYCRP